MGLDLWDVLDPSKVDLLIMFYVKNAARTLSFGFFFICLRVFMATEMGKDGEYVDIVL